jgi:DNA-binding Lrp family transcriptional regulator
MVHLDVKDRKILYYLLLDSRQSLKSIGKKVGISKELVLYRIRRLTKNKIINNYYALINFEALGYSIIMTHYKFINVTPTIKEEILNYFIQKKNTFYVSLVEGTNDLQVDFLLGNPSEFEALIEEIREKYHQYLAFKSSKFYIRAEFYNYSFLVEPPVKKINTLMWRWGHPLTSIDDLDFKILRELSKDTRMPTKTIAKNINTTASTVGYRIKKFEKQRVIGQYTVNVDWSKIGYRWFHLQISLSDYSKKNQIVSYLRNNPYLIRRLKFLDLGMDLHFTFLLHSIEQLRSIIEDISTQFQNSINDYVYYSTFKIYKYSIMIPEILKVKNPLNKGQ